MTSPTVRHKASTLALKRALDCCAAAAGIVVLAPLLTAIAVAVKLDSPGPAVFRQTRIGLRGKPFRIYKFRSMVAAAPSLGAAITTRADPRVTRVGALMRRFKVDELPQLLNVLRGDMSLVGPRPEVPEYMAFYSQAERDVILSLRPGITDYAAILFHDESALLDGSDDPVTAYRRDIMPIKYAYYAKYREELSPLVDLQIILATLRLMIFGRAPSWVAAETTIKTVGGRTTSGANGVLAFKKREV